MHKIFDKSSLSHEVGAAISEYFIHPINNLFKY